MDHLNDNLETQRAIQVDKLRSEVDVAFKNRIATSYVDEEKLNTTGHTNSSTDVIKAVENTNGDFISFRFPKKRNLVFTTDSHLYPQLILLAYDKLNNSRKPDILDIQESLNEEYKHITPVIGDNAVKIGYAIEFEEAEDGPIVVPQVVFEGKIHRKVFADMLTNPETHSISDEKIMLHVNLPR